MLRLIPRVAALVLLVLAARPLGAQAPAAPAASSTEVKASSAVEPAAQQGETAAGHAAKSEEDFITPHIIDAHAIDVPSFSSPFVQEIELPRWAPVHLGPVALDLSPTKHVVMMLLAALIATCVLVLTARAQARHHDEGGHIRGFAGGIEAMVLYMRNEVILRNVGPHGNAFVPFLLTLFFFILTANLIGLIPYGSTATGNISVTATLAVITFVVVEIAGMVALGRGYINTIIFWPHDMPLLMRIPMSIVISPIELVGKITRPIALAIRLFANMTAGHIVMLAFIGLIFYFGKATGFASLAGAAPFLMAIAIMLLELMVSFLQAFIFTLLSSVFIGLVRVAHH